MAMNGFTKDMNIIQKLNDEPNDRDGLTAGELKAKFDEGGLAVKDYLNNTVKPHVDGMEEDADAHAADAVKHITAEERANWNNKVDKVSGKGLSTNDYTTAEKNKLAGIEAQANKYTHPAYTARTGKPTANLTPGFGDTVTVSQITSDATGHVTGATDRTIKLPATAASTSAAGLMSAADKTKLNGIAAGAQVNSITGVKGNAEGSYRTGNVNLTPTNLGAAPASHTHTSDAVTDLVTATKYGPSGLVSFNGKEGLPLKSCIVGIEPAQSGSGDPSPSNVRAISGWTGLHLHVSPTEDVADGKTYTVDWTDEAGTVYGGTLDVLTGKLTIDKKVVVIKGDASETWSSVNQSYSIALIKTSGVVSGTLIASHYTSVITPVKWGNLGNNQAQSASDGYIGYKDIANNGTSVATAKAYAQQQYSNGTPITFVVKLKNPVIYQLTPQMVTTLAGQNRIWADAGDVTVEYGAFLQALEGEVENHTHDVAAIASGILPVARGGTGNSTGYVTAGLKSGTTLGSNATAEGHNVTASGAASHAEGEETVASAKCAHAEGTGTIASAENQHVFGKYNVSNDRAAEIVGWGTHTHDRKDIRSMNTAGDMWIAGTLTQASDARLKDVQGEVPDVSSIRAVRFKWNDLKGTHDEKDHIGYIAQDVEKLAPFLVGDDSNGYKSLDYIALLCAKVEWLERKVKALQAAAETEGGN